VMNFGGPDIYGDDEAERSETFVIIPVPYDLTSSWKAGSRHGPAAILEASAYLELYDEELRQETWRAGIATREALEPDVRGPSYMIEEVQAEVASVLKEKKIPVLLGGEHSVTLGAVKAAKERYPSLSVLQLDAHADLRDSYQNSPLSHACVGRRIVELCSLVQVGVRSMSVEEARFIDEKTDLVLSLSSDETRIDGWIDRVCERLTEDVYISIDLDVFDPSIIPATGTPEPGGMGWLEVLDLVHAIAAVKSIRGFDVVELCPLPGVAASDFTAAKLVYRVMGYIAEKYIS